MVACARTGDLERAGYYAEVARRSSQLWEGTSWQAAFDEARAHVTVAEGGDAIPYLDGAIHGYERAGQPIDVARATAFRAELRPLSPFPKPSPTPVRAREGLPDCMGTVESSPMQSLNNDVLVDLENERVLRQSSAFERRLRGLRTELPVRPGLRGVFDRMRREAQEDQDLQRTEFDGFSCGAERAIAGPIPHADVMLLARSLEKRAADNGGPRAVAFAHALAGEAALLSGFLRLARRRAVGGRRAAPRAGFRRGRGATR